MNFGKNTGEMECFEPTPGGRNCSGAFHRALELSKLHRLDRFIVDAESEPVAMFTPSVRSTNVTGDWYGEHAGKWLVAASLAAARTGDEELSERVVRIASVLADCQEPDGYLGTYSVNAPSRLSADAPLGTRTWDVWVHAYAILGLLAADPTSERFIEAARSAARLVVDSIETRGLPSLGNHSGLSAAVIIDPLVELAFATGEQVDLELAARAVNMIEGSTLQPIARLLEGVDVAHIGTGKAYQICWLLTGLAKWGRLNKDARILQAVTSGWASIQSHHLTLTGGPWGGIGRHKEVFNDPGFFSPVGLVETCSTMSWIHLNRELLYETGEARYAAEIENSALNALLGAIDENGHDWCYFTFPNGRRNNTYHWACCKSSGALALEDVARTTYRLDARALTIDLWLPGTFGPFSVNQDFSVGTVIVPEAVETIRVRIPEWSDSLECELNGQIIAPRIENGYLVLDGPWVNPDQFSFNTSITKKVHQRSAIIEHHGQEIIRDDYLALSFGPYCYASGLYEGFRRSETLALPFLHIENYFQRRDDGEFVLTLPGGREILLEPYYLAGGRSGGCYRRVWHEVAWQ